MIEVMKPGLFSLVQDRGRPGHYAIGMPPSGALDQYSHALANALVGNDADAATIETTFIGPELLFRTDTIVAVTGAEAPVLIDGEARPTWETLEVRAGQTLTVGAVSRGSRSYVAIRGGIATEPFLGSRSTYTPSGVGGLNGGALKAGDVLPIGFQLSAVAPRAGSSVPEKYRAGFASDLELRVVEGLCNYRFDRDALDEFFSSEYSISPESNRTGYRLSGPALRFLHREPVFGAGDNLSNVVDLGYPIGSIQVPNGDVPICLLRDAVTGGGYATLGTIISADLDALAQAKSPERVRFRRVELSEALGARRDRRVATAEAARLVSG